MRVCDAYGGTAAIPARDNQKGKPPVMGLTIPDGVAGVSTPKFVLYGTLLGLAVDLVAYPAELIKTQLQVARQVGGRNPSAPHQFGWESPSSHSQGTGTFFKDTALIGGQVWREEGFRGEGGGWIVTVVLWRRGVPAAPRLLPGLL